LNWIQDERPVFLRNLSFAIRKSDLRVLFVTNNYFALKPFVEMRFGIFLYNAGKNFYFLQIVIIWLCTEYGMPNWRICTATSQFGSFLGPPVPDILNTLCPSENPCPVFQTFAEPLHP
jgi:hypothetical protein